jgi:hypothetical protein
VAALLPGSDPTLAAETIIINSHYDHLPNRGETHYPGANDNASGTAAMLELARAFAASPERPRRSLLFVSFDSEEEGLLGSYYYVEHPLRPLASTLAVLNLDMIGRDESHIAATKGKLNVPADTSNLVNLVGGDYSPDLVAAIRRANKFANLELDEKYERDSTQNVLFPCDHFPFLWKDVPAVWIFGGLIVLGSEPTKSIIRAIGPSLPVDGALADPTLELHDKDGVIIATNDNWRSDQEAEIIATTVPPSNDAESAIVATLTPQAYTAIVRGKNNTTGVALVEAYQLDN